MADNERQTQPVQYYLAQYVPDPLRYEATNVGVILVRESTVSARFFAERTDRFGAARMIEAKKKVRHPSVYSQWLKFWRKSLKDGRAGIEKILAAEQTNFHVFPAGYVELQCGAVLDDIAEQVYLDLVDSRSDARPERRRSSSKRLRSEMTAAFRRRNLMSRVVAHPVQAGKLLLGSVAPHTPSFVQENGHLRVIDAIGLPPSISRSGIATKQVQLLL